MDQRGLHAYSFILSPPRTFGQKGRENEAENEGREEENASDSMCVVDTQSE